MSWMDVFRAWRGIPEAGSAAEFGAACRNAVTVSHDHFRPRCERCGQRMRRDQNFIEVLRANYAQHGVDTSVMAGVEALCQGCQAELALARCSLTGKVFFLRLDRWAEFRGGAMYEVLWPHHPYTQSAGPLSAQGLALIAQEHAAVQGRLANWAGGTRGEHIRGYRTVREVGVIREGRADDIATLEERLKRQAAILGGNGYVRFFWNHHTEAHAETYLRGYGPRGGPYYGTRHTYDRYCTGHAVAVEAMGWRGAGRG